MLFYDPVAAEVDGAPKNLLVISHQPGFVDGWMKFLDVLGVAVLLDRRRPADRPLARPRRRRCGG